MKAKILFATGLAVAAFVASTRGDGAPTSKPMEREYVLAKAQGQVLALLLQLEDSGDMNVKADANETNCTVIVTASKEAHDAIGPFVELLNTQAGVAYKKQFEERKKRGQETDKLRHQNAKDRP